MTEPYHSRYVAHYSKLMTETPGSTILHIPREVNTCPVVDSTTVHHFLPTKMDTDKNYIKYNITKDEHRAK
jgi:hypothetical protein